jgi:hypothetical protein
MKMEKLNLTPLKLPLSTLLGNTEVELVVLQNLSEEELETLGLFMMICVLRIHSENEDEWSFFEEVVFWLQKAASEGVTALKEAWREEARRYIAWQQEWREQPSRRSFDSRMISRLYNTFFDENTFNPAELGL